MRPVLCESCAAGKHRAYCPTFPRPCEDLIEIWDDAREATIEECARELELGIVVRGSASHFARRIRRLLTPPSAPAEKRVESAKETIERLGWTAPSSEQQVENLRHNIGMPCRHCGHGRNAEHHWLTPTAITGGHDYEPEEPGHG